MKVAEGIFAFNQQL